MQKPVHFDVCQVEEKIRAMHAENLVQARANAKTAADHQLLDMQDELFEIVVITNLTLLRCHNEGRDLGLTAQALGCVLGLSAGALVANRPHARDHFLHYFNQSLQGSVARQAPPGSMGVNAVVAGTVGGNA